MANADLRKAVGGWSPVLPGNYAVADLPAASADNKGCIAVVTDSSNVNNSVQLVVSDGSNWVYVGDEGATTASDS